MKLSTSSCGIIRDAGILFGNIAQSGTMSIRAKAAASVF
jgi:hypothetical protein